MAAGFALTSPAFEDGGTIPAKYTCDGEQKSPPLMISGVPEGTRSLAIIMDDPDIPEVLKKSHGIDVFDHWVVYNIPSPQAGGSTEIDEGAFVGSAGLNGMENMDYLGPCPPPEHEPHEHGYIFACYALSDELMFDHTPTKKEVLKAIEPVLIAETTLIGRYSRRK